MVGACRAATSRAAFSGATNSNNLRSARWTRAGSSQRDERYHAKHAPEGRGIEGEGSVSFRVYWHLHEFAIAQPFAPFYSLSGIETPSPPTGCPFNKDEKI